MRKLDFLRKPLKLALITVLTVLISTAMLVFCLQSFLDGLVMEHSMNTTAYVGTVYSRLQEYPMLKEIPPEILQQLESSDTVDEVMVTPVYSARAAGLTHAADGFENSESLSMKLFVEGTVAKEPSIAPGAFGMWEQTYLEITSLWGGSWENKGIPVCIVHDSNTKAPQLKKGDHVFLVGRYNSNTGTDVTGMLLFDPEMLDSVGHETDSAIWNHSILVLPKNISQEESDARINEFLRETGLGEPLALMDKLQDMVTLYEVEDMSMLLTVAEETTFLTAGRELRSNDFGSRVCVIHEALARQNGLAVGDTVSLSIADGCYIYDSDFEDLLGWKSGYPFEGDTLLEYKPYGEFGIVGLYSEINRSVGSVDYAHHARNDIFIPSGTLPGSTAGAQARSVTFRVLGPNYEDFMNTFEVPLNEQGYMLSIVDTGWESVSGSFFAMSDRRAVMTACTIVAFVAAVLSFDVLLFHHFRYEYALRRLLGAMPGEARGIYISAFLVTAIPAGLAAMLSSFGAYLLWLKGQFSAALPAALPANGGILAYLAVWTAAEIAAAFVFLMILSRVTNRQSLIKLLK